MEVARRIGTDPRNSDGLPTAPRSGRTPDSRSRTAPTNHRAPPGLVRDAPHPGCQTCRMGDREVGHVAEVLDRTKALRFPDRRLPHPEPMRAGVEHVERKGTNGVPRPTRQRTSTRIRGPQRPVWQRCPLPGGRVPRRAGESTRTSHRSGTTTSDTGTRGSPARRRRQGKDRHHDAGTGDRRLQGSHWLRAKGRKGARAIRPAPLRLARGQPSERRRASRGPSTPATTPGTARRRSAHRRRADGDRDRSLIDPWGRVPAGQHVTAHFFVLPIDGVVERQCAGVAPVAVEPVGPRCSAGAEQCVDLRRGPHRSPRRCRFRGVDRDGQFCPRDLTAFEGIKQIARRHGCVIRRRESVTRSPHNRRTIGSSVAVSTPADGHGRAQSRTNGAAAATAPSPIPTSTAAKPA